jgi:hypothetical protein
MSKGDQFLEPGLVFLLATTRKCRANVMAMSWRQRRCKNQHSSG